MYIWNISIFATNITNQRRSNGNVFHRPDALKFLTYENSDFEFTVQYPLNWSRHETDISGSFSNEILGALKDTAVARPVVDFCPPSTINSSSTSISHAY
ncbi:MAG: hypothetical protein ACJ71R_06980 [Nitrososphaeraceae archaeon]